VSLFISNRPGINCICRFSDRDLLMRYHWGLGVGHLHAHQHVVTRIPENILGLQSLECETSERQDEDDNNVQTQDGNCSDVCDSDSLEFSLKDSDLEEWEDYESGTEHGDQNEYAEEEDITGMW
jgi:hypothetical protein